MNLRIAAEAESEIQQARDDLNSQASGLGDRFLDELEQAFDAIGESPLSFPKLETCSEDLPYRRVLLKSFRYAMVFEIVGGRNPDSGGTSYQS